MPTDAKNFTADHWLFIRWLARPKAERQPKTQRQLALQIGVDESTLSDWKHLPGFAAAVTDLSRTYLKDDVPEVLATIRRLAKSGSQYHTNVFLAMAGLEGDVANAGKGNGSSIDAELTSKLDRLLSTVTQDTDRPSD